MLLLAEETSDHKQRGARGRGKRGARARGAEAGGRG